MGRAEGGGDGRLDVLLGDVHRFFAGGLRWSDGWASKKTTWPGVWRRASLFTSFRFPEIVLAEHSCNILLLPPRALVAWESNIWGICMVGKFYTIFDLRCQVIISK